MIQINKTIFQFTKRLALIVILIGMSNAAWAMDLIRAASHGTHYSKATITTSNGLGKVYVTSESATPNNNWVDVTSSAEKTCSNQDDNHNYYFYSKIQDNYLWAGWEIDNVFQEGTQNSPTSGNGNNLYYSRNDQVTARSTDQSSPTEINVIARWWEPKVTNVVINEVTTDPKNEETITHSDPNLTELSRTITFTTSEALAANNFKLTPSGMTYTSQTPAKWNDQYIIEATIPVSGVHGRTTTNTATLTSEYGGSDNKKSTATATITVVEDYTPLFGYSLDEYEFIQGTTESKPFDMQWLNTVAQHANTTWQVELTGASEFAITSGNNSSAPVVTFTPPASPAERYEATLTVSCYYTDKDNKQIQSNILDANGNVVRENGEAITTKTIRLIATFEPKIVFSPSSYDFGTIECGIEKSAEVSVFHNLEDNPTLTISGNAAFTFEEGQYSNKTAVITLNVASTLPVGTYTATLTANGRKENGDPITKQMTITANVILQTPVLRGAPSNQQANLSWDKIPGATRYEIVWSGNGNSGTFTISDPNQTSYQHTGLTNDIPYTYTLTAYCGDKDRKTSNTVTVIPQYYPQYIAKNQQTYTDGSVAVAANNTGLYTGPNNGEKNEINVSAAFSGDQTKFEWLYLFVAQTAEGKYPCYIYRKDGQRYRYFDQTEMTNGSKNKTYFELTTDIGRVYLTGYCGSATTGNAWAENGVLHIKKGSSNTVDLYLDGLQLYAKSKSKTTYSTTDATEVVSNFAGKSLPMEGSGAIFVFDGRNGGFNPTLHVCNENILQSTQSMNLNIDADGTVESGWQSQEVKFQMICQQESSVIQAMVDGQDDAFAITITDTWHNLDDATNTNEYRTNGSITLQNSSTTANHPLVNLGHTGSSFNIAGGQVNFGNKSDICITESYQYLYRKDKISSESAETNVYGCSNASISNSKNENNGLQEGYGLKGTIAQTMKFLDGTISAAVSPLVCPDNTTIDGGSYLCDIKAGNTTQKDLFADDDYELLAYTNKNSNGKNVYRIPVDITESVGTIENGLAVFNTELTTDGKDCFQVLMDNIFPMANYKTTENGQEVYASLSGYYNPSTKYGHSSLAPEGTKLYLMLPQDGTISSYTGWAMCVPEVQNVNQEIGGEVKVVSAGGATNVISTTKVPVAQSNLKLTNRLLYAEIDEITKGVVKDLGTEEDDASVTLGHHVTNKEEYTINEKVYMLLPVVAGEWRMIVAPFDVHNVYAIEAYPEEMLKKVYGEEKRAGSGRYYITDIEGAQNAQARRLLDLLVYWMGYENLDTDFFGAAGGYGPFVQTWMLHEANTKDTKNGAEVDGDYTPLIEQLYHFTGTKGTYPNDMSWYDANYYLYKSFDGSWELNEETGVVETDWKEVTEQSVPRAQGTPNVIMQKGGFYSMQFPAAYTSDGWDYWTGKYILLEGYGPQTVDGSETINQLLGQSINTPISGVQLYGNGSFAKSVTLTHDHLYHTAKNTNGVLDLIRKTDAKEFGPIEGFAIGNLDQTTQSINDEGQIVQTQKIAKSISMETGEVMYEVNTEIIDNPGLGSGIPTIMNGMTLIVEPTELGLTITPIKEQHVTLFDADGKMIFSKHLSAEENVTLPTGVYVVRGEYEQVKAIKK